MSYSKKFLVPNLSKAQIESIKKVDDTNFKNFIVNSNIFSQKQKEFVQKNINFLIDKNDSWLKKDSNNHIFDLDSANYPSLLKEIYNPPSIIYALGNINLLNSDCCAIVGSRNPNPNSVTNTKEISQKFATNGITLVSGLAIGIDSIVHESALSVLGKTIAVLPCGVDVIYPQINQQLYSQVIEKNLIISEYPLGERPKKHYFVQRNRIVTGLSKATIIIEAKQKSGTMTSAIHALAQNREIMTIPIGFGENFASGNLELLENGATCIKSAEDALLKYFRYYEFLYFDTFEETIQFLNHETKKFHELTAKGFCQNFGTGYRLLILTEK